MRFQTTRGRELVLSVSQSDFPLKTKEESRSEFQYNVGQYLLDRYPNFTILEEFYIPEENLFIDFYIPFFNLAIECQGQQHDCFNKFYHKNLTSFQKQKDRDYKKENFCRANDITLVYIPYSDSLSDEYIDEFIAGEF